MSKVAFLLGSMGTRKLDVIKLLRESFGLEVARVANAAGSGSPLFVREIFDDLNGSFARTLQVVLEKLESMEISYNAFELLNSQEYSDLDSSLFYKLDSKRLQKMIDARQQSLGGFL